MAGGYQKLDNIIDHVEEAHQERSTSSTYNRIAVQAMELRKRNFNFSSYYKNQAITDTEYHLSDQIIPVDSEERAFIIKRKPDVCVQLFLNLLSKVRKDESLQMIMTVLSDITEDENTTKLLVANQGCELIKPLLNILFRNDNYNKFQASLVVARLAASSKDILPADDLRQFLSWTIGQLSPAMEQYWECVSKTLMTFLKKECYRNDFYSANGIKPVLDVLDRRVSFQLHYQLVFIIWMLSFNVEILEKMKEYPVAVVLCDVLKATNREKVQRIILATFRNFIELPSKTISALYATDIIHFKVIPVLSVLMKQTRDDTDLTEDVEFLHEKLNNYLQDLSSFDEYSAEVKSGRLEWSPCHRSDKFWRENVMRLNENRHEILRMLVAILEESQNSTAIAVASHDLGEYVRYYPRGKKNVDELGGKSLVMNLVNHGNSEVRMQALLAIQKMMVQNWEYLGKQLQGKS
ncbi:V-type proton ATPase subunit H-like isoform X2 [Halichondria panicea]|uniref:V-type proton ATPase subunit H-like isoform X2 n=1 Tax=Halichondria panicea TaxID=6063 RepID=UPI00312BCBC2